MVSDIKNWIAKAEYVDGTRIERRFPYYEDVDESEQEYEIEEWLIRYHDGLESMGVEIED